jgi:hypothetical protein
MSPEEEAIIQQLVAMGMTPEEAFRYAADQGMIFPEAFTPPGVMNGPQPMMDNQQALEAMLNNTFRIAGLPPAPPTPMEQNIPQSMPVQAQGVPQGGPMAEAGQGFGPPTWAGQEDRMQAAGREKAAFHQGGPTPRPSAAPRPAPRTAPSQAQGPKTVSGDFKNYGQQRKAEVHARNDERKAARPTVAGSRPNPSPAQKAAPRVAAAKAQARPGFRPASSGLPNGMKPPRAQPGSVPPPARASGAPTRTPYSQKPQTKIGGQLAGMAGIRRRSS